MTEVRESPSGPLVQVGGGPDVTVLDRITIGAFTNVDGGAVLERTVGLGPIVSAEDARKWRVTANLVPNDTGVTTEIPVTLVWQPVAVQLGSDEVEARVSLRNPGEDATDTGDEDLVFAIAAYYFSAG